MVGTSGDPWDPWGTGMASWGFKQPWPGDSKIASSCSYGGQESLALDKPLLRGVILQGVTGHMQLQLHIQVERSKRETRSNWSLEDKQFICPALIITISHYRWYCPNYPSASKRGNWTSHLHLIFPLKPPFIVDFPASHGKEPLPRTLKYAQWQKLGALRGVTTNGGAFPTTLQPEFKRTPEDQTREIRSLGWENPRTQWGIFQQAMFE